MTSRVQTLLHATLLLAQCAIVCGAAALPGQNSAARFSVSAGALEVKTHRYQVRFEGPRITVLRNLLTGEIYTQGREVPAAQDLAVRTLKGHRGLPAGKWQKRAGGVYTWEASEGDLRCLLDVSVDGKTQDLVLRQRLESSIGGLAGAGWILDRLSLSGGTRLVLPARGGRVMDAGSHVNSLNLDYPQLWEAQLAILEGKNGSAAVWSTDGRCGFKNLRLRREGDSIALAFETEPEGAFKTTRSVRSAEWRLNVFRGDWREPAGRYRNLMRRLYPAYRYRPEQAWAKEVQAVVMIIEPRDLRTGLLDQLAPLVDPSRTLIYLPQWRSDLKNINFPDYGHPHATFPAFISRAHELGFRVMVHTNLPGCSVSHPAYEKVRHHQVRMPDTGELFGWLWGEGVPQTFAYINLASPEWRKILVGEIAGAVRKFGIDAVHLDVSGPIMNDASGLISGMNYGQGSRLLHKELLDALPPEVVLGGETVNEITSGFEVFAQLHGWSGLPPHPVSAFLFDEQTTAYGYLGLPNPDTGSPSAYDAYNEVYERQGVIPSLTLASNADLSTRGRGTARILKLMRLWQAEQPRPDFSFVWPEKVRFAYLGKSGDRISIEREDGSTRLLCGNQVMYWRVSGVNAAQTSWTLSGWPASAAGPIFGLNPAQTYWLEETDGESGGIRVTELPPGAYISALRRTPKLLSIEIDGDRSGRCAMTIEATPVHSWLPDGISLDGRELSGELRLPARLSFAFAEPFAADVPVDLSMLPAAAGFAFGGIYTPLPGSQPHDQSSDRTEGSNLGIGVRNSATCRGIVKDAVGAHPPNQGQTWLTWVVSLPAQPVELVFSAGLRDGVARRARVLYRILVNGEPRWETELASEPSWADGSIDLSAPAGRPVVIDLVTDSVGDNAYDLACWADVWIRPVQARSSGSKNP